MSTRVNELITAFQFEYDFNSKFGQNLYRQSLWRNQEATKADNI